MTAAIVNVSSDSPSSRTAQTLPINPLVASNPAIKTMQTLFTISQRSI
jgi:hypothetical protein